MPHQKVSSAAGIDAGGGAAQDASFAQAEREFSRVLTKVRVVSFETLTFRVVGGDVPRPWRVCARTYAGQFLEDARAWAVQQRLHNRRSRQ
jgi:hypothetical protein